MEKPFIFLTANIVKALLSEEARSLWGVRDQVEQLGIELTRMQSFLEDMSGIQSGGAMSKNWFVEATELANESQDIIETFLLKVASRRKGGVGPTLKRYAFISKEWFLVLQVWLQLQTIKGKINSFNRSLEVYGIRTMGESSSSSASQSRPDWRKTYHYLKEYTTVGLEEDAEMVAKQLVEDGNCLVVSIYGLGGLGKTTLARKVFHHKEVKCHFVGGIAWACVSQKYDRRDILHGILTKLAPEMKESVKGMRDDELLEKLYQVQRERNCLIVLDDIWSIDAWSSFKSAFPITENISTGSKILITTRDQTLGSQIHPSCFRYQPRYLDNEESWNLLKSKAFGAAADDLKISPEMEAEGRKMAEECKGLPLAIVVLGGLLADKGTLARWQEVYKMIKSQRRSKDHEQEDEVSKVLSLSYHDLPYKYKPCFLYLSNFPEDYMIHAKTLYRLWIAEDVVSTDDKLEDEIMMDVAERYLNVLVRRCIVQVAQVKFSGKIKYCRIHDVMRDFCLVKAKKHNFLAVAHPQDVTDQVSCSSKIRRLAVHLNRHHEDKVELPQSDKFHYLRSILFVNPSISLSQIKLDWNFKNFKLLKTLQLEKYSSLCQKSVESIGKLVSLRHLSVGFVEGTTFLYKLKNLQTLDLWGGDGPIVFENMGQLRHLSIHNWRGNKIKLLGLTNLETLEGFNIKNFDVNDLFKLKSLRRLVKATIDLRGEDQGLVILAAFVEYLNSSESHRLRKTSVQLFVDKLDEELLSLLGQLFGCARISNLFLRSDELYRLPKFNCSTSGLTYLSLRGTRFEEDPMPTLERLPKLQRLIMSDCSFDNIIMTCFAGGFPQLKTLKLCQLYGLKDWRVDEIAMPNLSTLEMEYCPRLEMFPNGLKSITTLEKISIRRMPETFTSGLRAVDFHKVPVIQIINGTHL